MFNKIREAFDKILCKISKKRRLKKINAEIKAEKIFNSLINPTDLDSESLYLENTTEFKSPKLNAKKEFSWREEHKKSEKLTLILIIIIIILSLWFAGDHISKSNQIEKLEFRNEEINKELSGIGKEYFILEEEFDSIKTALEIENNKYKKLLDLYNIDY